MQKKDHFKKIAEELQMIRQALESLVPAAEKIADAMARNASEANIPEYEIELYEEAKKAVQEIGKASTAFLQRKLGIGYARAALLMDLLEANGVIGPATGTAGRRVYERITPQMKNILASIEAQLSKKTKTKKKK